MILKIAEIMSVSIHLKSESPFRQKLELRSNSSNLNLWKTIFFLRNINKQ